MNDQFRKNWHYQRLRKCTFLERSARYGNWLNLKQKHRMKSVQLSKFKRHFWLADRHILIKRWRKNLCQGNIEVLTGRIHVQRDLVTTKQYLKSLKKRWNLAFRWVFIFQSISQYRFDFWGFLFSLWSSIAFLHVVQTDIRIGFGFNSRSQYQTFIWHPRIFPGFVSFRQPADVH